MLLELLAVGTFWFWAIIVAEIILLFYFYEYENGWAATVSVATFLALLQWGSKVNVIGYCMDHPWNILSVVGAYFALGVVWGIFKWRLYVGDCVHEYEEEKVKWLERKGFPEGTKVIPEEHRADWVSYLNDYNGPKRDDGSKLSDTPLVRKNKARITRWMSMWVISLIWSLIHDFLHTAFSQLYRSIASWLQSVANSVWAKNNIAEDTNVPKK